MENRRGLMLRRMVAGHSDRYLTSFTSGADAQASVAGIASFGVFQQRRAQSGGLGRSGERRVVQIYLSPAADISCRTRSRRRKSRCHSDSTKRFGAQAKGTGSTTTKSSCRRQDIWRLEVACRHPLIQPRLRLLGWREMGEGKM